MTLYKFLRDGGIPTNGTGAWSMPTRNADGSWTRGEWREEKGPLKLCAAGTLHACEPEHLSHWISDVLVEVEVDGEVLRGDAKVGALRMRVLRVVESWTRDAAILVACDAAERALLRARRAGREPHAASWEAIVVARGVVAGTHTSDAARSAADAARSAADAARSAADAARSAADAARSAADAARSAAYAARSAAYAAWSAAYAASSAEYRWISRRLLWRCGEIADEPAIEEGL